MAKISRFSVPPPLTPWRAQYPTFHVPRTVADPSDGDKGDIVVSDAGQTWMIDGDVLSTWGRTLIDDPNAPAALATLGAASAASLAAYMPLDGGQFTGPVMFAGDPDFKASIEAGRYWQLQFDVTVDGSSYFGWDAVAKQVYIGLDGPVASNYFTMSQSECEVWQPLIVPTPVNPGHAANKAYVDAHTGGIADAPNDGTQYGRQSAGWTAITPNPTWTTLTGKPATFPPTLPIAESDVTNLTTDLAGKQPLDSDLTTIAALAPADNNVMQRKAGAWVGSTPATVKTDLALTKSDVGLANVDNTADTAKPVSTAQATALALKADLAGATFTGNVIVDRTGAGSAASCQIKGDATTLRHVSGYTGANLRWQFRLGDTTAEGGANAGSNHSLLAYDDAGTIIGTVYTVPRATRVLDFTVAPTVGGVGLEKVGTRRAINTQTASYTLALGDEGKVVEMNNASALNLTVPLNATAAFALNTWIDVSQYGAGQVTVVATGGVTLRSAGGLLKTRVQYSGLTLIKRATDEWYVFGDLG